MREKILLIFLKKEFFRLKVMYSEQKKKKNKRKNKETNKQTNKQTKKVEEYINHVILFVEENSRDINNDLFREYFNFSTPIDLTKKSLRRCK